MTEPVILHFADGSTKSLFGYGDFVLRLFQGVFGSGVLSPGQASQLDMIRQCVSFTEPGGGRMVELLRVLLNAREQSRPKSLPAERFAKLLARLNRLGEASGNLRISIASRFVTVPRSPSGTEP